MLQLDSKIACQVKITGQVASCSESGAIANFWQYPTLGNSWQRWCVANSQLLALANSWQRQQLRQYNWRNVANAAQADPQYQPVRNNIRSRVQLVGLGVALIGVAIVVTTTRGNKNCCKTVISIHRFKSPINYV
jgi:hypothetical protein